MVISSNGEIISIAHTTLHEQNDATCHAEVNAIRQVCAKIGSRLSQTLSIRNRATIQTWQ